MAAHTNTSNKPQIIVIDDSQMILKFLQVYLSKEFEVHTYTTGEEALKDIQSGVLSTDCVITDYTMPESMSGLEVLQQLKMLDDSIPAMVLSGECDVQDKIKSFNMGAYDFVSKPFNPLELVARVHSVIATSTKGLRYAG